MSEDESFRLGRSRQELDAARLLAERGFGVQAISRASYAAFYASQEALLSLGETRSKHSGVVSAFGRKIVREGGMPETAGRLLRSLFERRNEADYAGVPASADEAGAAIEDAERFVDAVEDWLAGRTT